MANYLFAGEVIKQRLQQAIPEFKQVLLAGNLAQIAQHAQQSPCAYVIYQGDVINPAVEARGTASLAQLVKQEWMIVVVVNLADKSRLNNGDALAGELITKMLKALSGYRIQHCKPLYRSAKGINVDYQDGWGYYPFLFNVEFSMVTLEG